MDQQQISKKLDNLIAEIKKYKRPLLALSGGLDSSFLTFAIYKSGVDAATITIKSSLFPDSELNRACSISKEYNLPNIILDLTYSHLSKIQNNPHDRCYICKKMLFSKIKDYAENNDFDVVFDGTTYDDLDKYRPGIKAKDELNVVSPLVISKIAKDELRGISRFYELEFSELPSFSCFATRFPYNYNITVNQIKSVASAEKFIKECGFSQVRVRCHDDIARIELSIDELGKIIEKSNREKIVKKLDGLGFKYVTIDLQGFNSGSMDK